MSGFFNNKVDAASVTAQINIVNTGLAERAKEITPLLFGAVGDGISDDRRALIDTFNYAMNNNITVNLLDGKTYLVNSKDEALTGSNANIFEITKKINIKGRSTIKIGVIGDYETVFRLRTGCSGSTFKEFTLDENTVQNLTTENVVTVAPVGKRRIAFYGWNTGRLNGLVFDGIIIKNCIGQWQIQAKADDCRVVNITVEYEKDNGGIIPAYDRTCLYMAGSNWVARDNKFLGYSDHARTCIETHGNNITVDNNFINNFTTMLYVVNDAESGNTNLDTVQVINNNFKCRRGLQLWFSPSNCSLKNVKILNNTLEVTGDYPVISTQQYPGQNVVIDNLKIESNTLILNSATAVFMDIYSASNTTITEPALIYNNVIVQNNTFVGKCKYAFEFVVQPAKHHVIKLLKILNNTFKITELNNYLFRVLDVPYAFERIEIKGNSFQVETIASSLTEAQVFTGAMSSRTTNQGTVLFEGNKYTTPSGSNFRFANSEGTKFLSVKESFERNITNGINGLLAYKGEFTDHLGQSMKFDVGAVSKRVFYLDAKPTTGTYKTGDIVYINTPTAGGYLGWVCTVAGTPGTWKGFGLIEV